MAGALPMLDTAAPVEVEVEEELVPLPLPELPPKDVGVGVEALHM
jgi:hypothetical protein